MDKLKDAAADMNLVLSRMNNNRIQQVIDTLDDKGVEADKGNQTEKEPRQEPPHEEGDESRPAPMITTSQTATPWNLRTTCWAANGIRIHTC